MNYVECVIVYAWIAFHDLSVFTVLSLFFD